MTADSRCATRSTTTQQLHGIISETKKRREAKTKRWSYGPERNKTASSLVGVICFVTQETNRTCVTARLVSDVSVRKFANCLQIHVLFAQDAANDEMKLGRPQALYIILKTHTLSGLTKQ